MIATSASSNDPTVFKVRHRLDSSVWTPEMVNRGLEGVELRAEDVKDTSSINFTNLSVADEITVRDEDVCNISNESDKGAFLCFQKSTITLFRL